MKLVQRDQDGVFQLRVNLKEKVNHDIIKIRLEFPNETWISGLWPGGHFVLMARIGTSMVARKYTPVSPVDSKGFVDFYIKIYRDEVDSTKKGGLFSQWVERSLREGDSIFCEAPKGQIKFYGFGFFIINNKTIRNIKKVLMLAAGTGLTPMISIVQASTFLNDGL